jgi:hypothetical protein
MVSPWGFEAVSARSAGLGIRAARTIRECLRR